VGELGGGKEFHCGIGVGAVGGAYCKRTEMSDSDDSDDVSVEYPDNDELKRLNDAFSGGLNFDAYLENHIEYYESPLRTLRSIVDGDEHGPYSWMVSGSDVLTTSDAWGRAGQMLAGHPSVQMFELDSNEFSRESFRVFMAALEGNKTINNLTICENPHVGTNEGSRVLSAFLRKRKCPIDSLELQTLGISLSSFQMIAPTIGRSGLSGQRVKELCLTGNDFSVDTEEKCATLYRSLTNLSLLTKLDLRGCNLGVPGCIAVAKFVRCNNFNLAEISLASNNLNDKCCEMLARSFLGKKSIKEITLSDNDDITLAGLTRFGLLLAGNQKVRSIEGSNHNVRANFQR